MNLLRPSRTFVTPLKTARSFVNATDAVNFGIVPYFDGIKSFTLAFRLKLDPLNWNPTGEPQGVRSIISMWGPNNVSDGQVFLLRQRSNGQDFDIYFQKSGWFHLLDTADGPLFKNGSVDPEWNTFFLHWNSAQSVLNFWKTNPVESTLRTVNRSIAGFDSFPSPVLAELWIGKEVITGVNSIRGGLCDVVFFDGAISEQERNKIGAGASPDIVTSARILFWAPLSGNGSSETTAKTADSIVRNGAVFGTTAITSPFASPLTISSNVIISPTKIMVDAGQYSQFSVQWGILGPTKTPLILKPSANYGKFSPESATLGTDKNSAVTFKYLADYVSQNDIINVTNNANLPSLSVPVEIKLPPAKIKEVRVLPHGQSILVDFIGPDGNPARILNAQPPTLSVNGGAAIKLAGPISPVTSGKTMSSWATYLLPSTPQFLSWYTATELKGEWAPFGGGYLGKGNFANKNGNDLNATATYVIAGLEPGATYSLSATWPGFIPVCPKAIYTVYNGDSQGKILGIFAGDQSQVASQSPAWVAENNFDWATLGKFSPQKSSVSVVVTNGAKSGVLAADGIRIERIRQFTTINKNDAVTITTPQGWAMTEVGEVQGVSSVPVINLAGGLLSPISNTGRRMKIGWNTEEPFAFASSASFYNNRYHSVYNYTVGPRGSAQGATADSLGNLTSFPTTGDIDLTVSTNTGDGVGPRGLGSCPSDGVWTVKHVGAPHSVTIVGTRPDDITEPIDEKIDPKTGENIIRARITAGPSSTAPAVSLRFYNPENPKDVPKPGSLKIFDPYADPTESTLFSPHWLELTRGASCFRHLETFCYANSNAARFEDLSDDSLPRLGVNFPARSLGGEIIKIGPVDVSPSNKDRALWYFRNGFVIKLTFAAPHELSDGQMVSLVITDPDVGGYKNFPTVTGGNLQVVGGIIIVLNPTTIMMTCAGTAGAPLNGSTDTITKEYEPPKKGDWQIKCDVCTGPSLKTIIESGRVTGAAQWLSLPHPVTDDCCTKIGQYLVANSKKGQKFAIEYSNEVWNMNGGYYYAVTMSNYTSAAAVAGVPDAIHTGYNARNWYALRSGQVHKLIHDEFDEVGRSDDLIRIMASQTGYAAGATMPVVDMARNLNIPIDWLAIDGYLDNESAGGRYDLETAGPLIDSMNNGQLIDMFAVHVRRDNSSHYIQDHRKCLDQYGFTDTKLVVYEGGVANPVPSVRTFNRVPTAQAILRDPDIYPVVMDWFQVQQENNVDIFNWFLLNGGPYVAQGAGWACYPSYAMKPGRGNGIDGQFDNRKNSQNLRRIVSVCGYAVKDWITNTPAKAVFVGMDAATQGNWKGKYGAGGANIAQAPSGNNLSINMSDVSEKLWQYPATDKKGLQGTSNRTSACWYSGVPIYFSVNTPKTKYRLSVYVLDWNNGGGGRREKFDILDISSGEILDSQVAAGFQNGKYLTWNVEGNVSVRVTNLNPSTNSVLSAIFID